MAKHLTVLILAALALLTAACSSDNDTQGKKPTRQSDAGQLPWAKPATWEGGMPGMPTNRGAPGQY